MTNINYRSPRRILMTADTLGGVWTYAFELCRGLNARGVEIVLATMGSPLSAWQQKEIDSLDLVTCCQSGFKLEWMPDCETDLDRAGHWLMELASRFTPDIIHLNNYAHATLPFSAPVVVVGHSCISSWWNAVHYAAPPPQFNGYRAMVRAGIAAADMVVAPSRSMLSSLEQHYGPRGDTRVIYNGRSSYSLDLQSKEELILSVGRLWDKAKNTAALESIAGQLPWPVYIAGQTHHPDGTDSSFNNLHHLGQLAPDQLALWFARASIYVLPARYEPFGLSVLEAALAGCALVLGDIDSLREIWSDAAVFVPPGDTAQLARVITSLIDNPATCDQLSLCAYHRARQFLPDRMVDQYMDVYNEVLCKTQVSVG